MSGRSSKEAKRSLLSSKRARERRTIRARVRRQLGLLGLIATSCIVGSCGATQQHILITPRLPSGFAVFNQASTAGDVIPREVATTLAQSTQPEFSYNDIQAARRVLPDEPGWLVPAVNGELCLVRLVYPLTSSVHGAPLSPRPSRTCASESTTLAGGLVVTASLATSGKATQVFGIVPDGVTSVKIVVREGHAVRIGVLRNAYSAIVLQPVKVEFLTIRNHHTMTEAVPLSVSAIRNTAPLHQSGL